MGERGRIQRWPRLLAQQSSSTGDHKGLFEEMNVKWPAREGLSEFRFDRNFGHKFTMGLNSISFLATAIVVR
jgi:hypothetical protein